jgi:hypothetical protein
VLCSECSKPRLIYSESAVSKSTVGHQTRRAAAATKEDKQAAFDTALQQIADDHSFVCGVPLFPPSSPWKQFVVNSNLTCSDPIEHLYYGRKNWPQRCGNCGREDGLEADTAEREALLGDTSHTGKYSVAAPQCSDCKQAGLRRVTGRAKRKKQQEKEQQKKKKQKKKQTAAVGSGSGGGGSDSDWDDDDDLNDTTAVSTAAAGGEQRTLGSFFQRAAHPKCEDCTTRMAVFGLDIDKPRRLRWCAECAAAHPDAIGLVG